MRSAWAKRFGLVITCVAVIGISGCAGGESAPETAPTTQEPARPPVDGGRYALPSDIADKIKAAGLGCDYLEKRDSSRGTCLDIDDRDIVIRIIVDATELQAEIDAMGKAVFLKGRTMLSGQNWTVVAYNPTAEKLAEVLGGLATKAPS